MKLMHIFWSLLILVLLIYFPWIFYRTNGKFHGGAELYALFILVWLIISIVSPITLTICVTRIFMRDIRFWLTLLMVFNLFYGAYVTFLIIYHQILKVFSFALTASLLNILWGILIVIYIGIKYNVKQQP